MFTKTRVWLTNLVKPRPGQTPNLFSASSSVLGLGAVYLYFTGYVFSYFYYFQGFGVTLESLDLSPQFYFMRSYTVFSSVRGALVLTLLVMVVVGYTAGALRRAVVILALAAAFPALFWGSQAIAQRAANEALCNPINTVQFQFKEKEGKDGGLATQPAGGDPTLTRAKIAEMANESQLSLLLETKDRIVVFKIPGCKLGPPDAQVYTLLRDDLNFTSILR